jgi:predicted  nucleic acid-binding Zn-ribbon protein
MKLHPELELLLEIQDLRRYASDREPLGREALDRDRVHREIERRIARLSPRTRSTYDKVAQRYELIAVPVVDGSCHGCHVRLPRCVMHSLDVKTCDHCGRFLY